MKTFQKDAERAIVKFQAIIDALLAASVELEVIGSSSELMALDDAMESLKEMKKRAESYVRGE